MSLLTFFQRLASPPISRESCRGGTKAPAMIPEGAGQDDSGEPKDCVEEGERVHGLGGKHDRRIKLVKREKDDDDDEKRDQASESGE